MKLEGRCCATRFDSIQGCTDHTTYYLPDPCPSYYRSFVRPFACIYSLLPTNYERAAPRLVCPSCVPRQRTFQPTLLRRDVASLSLLVFHLWFHSFHVLILLLFVYPWTAWLLPDDLFWVCKHARWQVFPYTRHIM